MIRRKFKILDDTFLHCQYSNNPLPPVSFSKYIKWDRNVSKKEELVFYTDKYIDSPKRNHERKIAWLIEPYSMQPKRYDWILDNNHLFEWVLVNDKKLLDKGENFLFYPFGGCWVEPKNRKIEHKKTKLASIICSSKQNTINQIRRHEIISKFNNFIDVMGLGYQPIESISTGLISYMFHIAIENQSRDYHFTEKLINPIMVGTVPIYYGMPSIENYFDTRGMIIFKEIDEIGDILKSLNKDLYKSMLPYVKENFKLAQDYVLAEDWMYKNIFKKMLII